MTYWALGCVQKCDPWAWRRNEKGQKLSCVKLAICPDHPRRRRPLKFCMRGPVLEVVIYFKFHENRSRGLRTVEGRKSPSPIDLAHGLYNSLYYRTSRDYYYYVEKNRVHNGTGPSMWRQFFHLLTAKSNEIKAPINTRLKITLVQSPDPSGPWYADPSPLLRHWQLLLKYFRY